ncbi:MAG: GTP cyclohydrolase I [Puniceicoccales bacterium]|jgi:GTP cyclohydrolase I|nr:GTP cyclohydrolase I [Puniceicoccales bacterium]
MNRAKVQRGIKMLLEGLGEDPSRAGLVDTPRRVADMVECFSKVWGPADGEIFDVRFAVERYDGFVLMKNIKFSSFCEHHLLPFFGNISLCYIPVNDSVTGLSRLVRIVDKYSKRLQLQERLTVQIADGISANVENRGVFVLVEAHHMCIAARGVCQPDCSTVTRALRGEFSSNSALASQVQQLILAGGGRCHGS